MVILVKLWCWVSLDQTADEQSKYINIICCFCDGVMDMRFWTLSVLFHLGFFAAFLYLKPDLMRPDLREKIYDDVFVVGFVYEAPVEKDNISLKSSEAEKQIASKSLRGQVRLVSKPKFRSKPDQGSVKVAATRAPVEKDNIPLKPIEAEKQIVSKSLREHVRLVSKPKVFPKPARESVRAVAARVPEGPAHSTTKIFETKKANAKKYQRVAHGVSQLNESSLMMAAATIPVKSSVLSAPFYKTCTSKSKLVASLAKEQNKNQENKQITITNLVGLHPAHRAALQGQLTSISALLGAKPRGRNPNIATLLGGSQSQSAQISCK